MEILLAVIGSGTLGVLITKIFDLVSERRKTKAMHNEEQARMQKELAAIKAALQLNEKDQLRTQLMLMLHDYPGERTEILRLAEHYFKDLGGNWVLTDIFRSWLHSQSIDEPAWLHNEK